jgi:2-methylisocitrate lyase-like PEP mutase family enzyme
MEMTMTQSPGQRLRKMIAGETPVLAPGAADALTARLIEEAGFDAVYCSGGAIARSYGLPDLGYVTLSMLAERVASISDVSTLPILVDADSGFGNPLGIQQTVRALERAGAAGLHIEDDNVPIRTRNAADNLISAEAMLGNLKAALSARQDPSFMIIARTSVAPRLGLHEAILRANRYAEAGADMVYVEFLANRADIEAVAKGVSAPKLVSQNKGHTALLPPEELGAIGFKIVTYPADPQLAAIHAIRVILKTLKESGTSAAFDAMATLAERDAVVATNAHRERLNRFLVE